MTKTLTIKQEKFCQVYIETGNASEAYRQAYNAKNMKPETVNRKAKELLEGGRGCGKVAARIDALQTEHRKRHDVTVDNLTTEYEEARGLAKESINPSAMVSATTGKAKLHGLLIEKREHSGTLTLATIYHELYDEDLPDELKEVKD
jgi:hypothetical protein